MRGKIKVEWGNWNEKRKDGRNIDVVGKRRIEEKEMKKEIREKK